MSVTEIVVGFMGLLASIGAAYLAYKRGSRADEAATETAAIAQVYAGYGGLLERVQQDNSEIRRRIAEAEKRLSDAEASERECERRYEVILSEVNRLRIELVAALHERLPPQ